MRRLRLPLHLLTAAYWLTILALTHWPAQRLPKLPPNDKLLHVLAYGPLGGLLFLCLWHARPHRPHFTWLVLPIGLAYGVLDELTQPWFNRTAAFDDWVADAVGLVIATVIMTLFRRLVERRAPAAGAP